MDLGTAVKAFIELVIPEKRVFLPEFTETFINECGEEVEISYRDRNLCETLPVKEWGETDYTALQTWINNLGEAMYNPLTMVISPEKTWCYDGKHRRTIHNCLNIPTRALSIKIPHLRELTPMERRMMKKYTITYVNTDSISVPHHFFKNNRGNKMRREMEGLRFYPPLTPVPDFYDKSPLDTAIRKGLPLGWSMEEMCRSIPKHDWRWLIPDMIQGDINIKGKRILDVGCSIGYHSMILLERGAEHATLNTDNKTQIKKINDLKNQRNYNVGILEGMIQDYIDKLKHYDVVLVLNMFHHVLKQTPDSWWIFKKLLDIGDNVYMTMGTTWDVIKEYDNDVERAFTSNIPCKLTELGHTYYRGRKLYRVDLK